MPNTQTPLRDCLASTRFGTIVTFALGLVLVSAPGVQAADGPKEDRWVSLFNGKNLEGWTPKITGHALGENHGNLFRVEDGVLKVSYEKYPRFDGQFGHLFTKHKYSNYRLRVVYRFVGEQCPGGPGWAIRNSGAMLHCQAPETMRQDQDFPVSIEMQYLGGDGKQERPTGSVCTPGTHIVMDGQLITRHCTNSKSKTYAGDQWVTAEAEVHGNGKITHYINGEVVLEYEKPQLDESDADAKPLIQASGTMLREGYIALQAESHPVEFKSVEILPLDE